MTSPPYRTITLLLFLMLLLALSLSAYYVLVLRDPTLPFPWA
jgi:hypothetical protein